MFFFSEGKGEMDPGVKFRLYVGHRRLEGNAWLHILWNLNDVRVVVVVVVAELVVLFLHLISNLTKLTFTFYCTEVFWFELHPLPTCSAHDLLLSVAVWVCVAVRKQDLGFSQTPFPFKDISFTFIFLNFNTKNGNSCSTKEQPLFDGIMSQRASTWPAIW